MNSVCILVNQTHRECTVALLQSFAEKRGLQGMHSLLAAKWMWGHIIPASPFVFELSNLHVDVPQCSNINKIWLDYSFRNVIEFGYINSSLSVNTQTKYLDGVKRNCSDNSKHVILVPNVRAFSYSLIYQFLTMTYFYKVNALKN